MITSPLPSDSFYSEFVSPSAFASTVQVPMDDSWFQCTWMKVFFFLFFEVSGPDAAAAGAQVVGGLKNKTLWIVIAAVAGITLIAIIIISVILCKKRSGDDIQR